MSRVPEEVLEELSNIYRDLFESGNEHSGVVPWIQSINTMPTTDMIREVKSALRKCRDLRRELLNVRDPDSNKTMTFHEKDELDLRLAQEWYFQSLLLYALFISSGTDVDRSSFDEFVRDKIDSRQNMTILCKGYPSKQKPLGRF